LEPVSENIVNVRLKAVQMAPQVGLLRLEAASALITAKDPQIAKAVLMPLLNNPHGGDMVEAAQAMVKAIDGSSVTGATKPEGDKKS
jgi:hypothetical protein